MFSCCVVGGGGGACPLPDSIPGMSSAPFADGLALGAANTDTPLAEAETEEEVVEVPLAGECDCEALR